MSALPFPETLDSSADLQIWNNAAFDKSGEIAGDSTAGRESWGSLKSVFENPKSSFDSDDAGKENDGRLVPENNVRSSPVSSSLKPSIEPLNARDESRTEGVSEKGIDESVEKKIDEEIADVERQMSWLRSRLEALRLEKSRVSAKAVEIVPAKFMDSTKVQRRGISLGPEEIMSGGGRRGVMSMGPSEIFGAVKSKQQMITPVQSRRMSCLSKLEDIDEKKAVTKERGKSCSVSPNSRKVTLRSQVAASRQAVTTVTSKKTYPVIHSVQPKKLFGEGEKSAPAASNKLSLKSGRVVASRYNQSSVQAPAMTKKSLPENDNGFSLRLDNKCPLSVGKHKVGNRNLGSDIRVKKRWEIPSEIVVHGSVEKSIGEERVLLPRIKVARCMRESPRDSGPAKKVVELIGRRSFFCNEDSEVAPSVCQALTYAEELSGVQLSGVELSFPARR